MKYKIDNNIGFVNTKDENDEPDYRELKLDLLGYTPLFVLDNNFLICYESDNREIYAVDEAGSIEVVEYRPKRFGEYVIDISGRYDRGIAGSIFIPCQIKLNIFGFDKVPGIKNVYYNLYSIEEITINCERLDKAQGRVMDRFLGGIHNEK